MKVPLPTCFATLRKGVDGSNANDGYDKMGVVSGRENCCPDSIQNFEHHLLVQKGQQARLNDCEVYVICGQVVRNFSTVLYSSNAT